MKIWLPILALAYLLGSIPFGYLLVRLFRKQDIRDTGSGNIGATNVVRSGAKGLGFLTLLLDTLKAFAAVKIAQHVAPGDTDLAALAAVFAVLGHVFPVWLGFKGGKGVASALGVFLALSWPAALSALAIFILVTAVSRYVSLGSIVASASLPLFLMLFEPSRSPIYISSAIFLALLIIIKHRANIARLKAGNENRMGSKKKLAASPDDLSDEVSE
jgi:acyl phosphate:glycerol-3-phosphate acyltransferase